jgi:hypothetical protein
MSSHSRPVARPGPRASIRPTPRPRWRRYLPWLLGATTGIVVCVAGLVTLLVINRPTPSPAATADKICTDLRSADYTSLFSALAPVLQEQGSDPSAQFSASQRELDIISGRVIACTYRLQQPDSVHATVTYLIARGSKSAKPAPVTLVYENSAWHIQQYDTSLI